MPVCFTEAILEFYFVIAVAIEEGLRCAKIDLPSPEWCERLKAFFTDDRESAMTIKR